MALRCDLCSNGCGSTNGVGSRCRSCFSSALRREVFFAGCRSLMKTTWSDRSPLVGYQRVCKFLGLFAFEPNLRCRKLNVGPLPELIANWDEICVLLAPTPFAWMLELEV